MKRAFAYILMASVACAPWSVAQDAGDLDLLWTQATLYRDEWGVPHVFAENPQALGFAFGYAQAEDHLESMLMAYRVANGTAAVVLGESHADSDAFALKMGHARLAQQAFPNLDPTVQALCVGFAQGVNRYILEHPAKMPPWVEAVAPQDLLALWHAFLMSAAPYDLPQPYRRPLAAPTGNAWALAPSRTAEDATTLVINPHQYHDGPFRWYEAHLRMGDLNMAGATLMGLPVIVQGHNDVLGWALTPNQPDIADLFVERVERPGGQAESQLAAAAEAQTLLLLYMSQARSYFVRTPNGLDERAVPAYIHGRGPVFEHGRELVSWRIGGYREFAGFRQLLDMGRAQNLEQFQAALRMQQIPSFHVLYADKAGNIAYLYNATTGTRNLLEAVTEEQARQRAGLDWKKPVPWEWDAQAWSSVVPVDALPYIENPESGFLQACGNPPWLATENAPVNPAAWPGWFIGDQDTYRAQRARQLLRSGTRSFRDNQAMLYDVVLPAAVDLAPMLVQFAESHRAEVEARHPDLLAGLNMLRDWNYVASPKSPAMTFYHTWWGMVRERAGSAAHSEQELYAALLQPNPQSQRLALDAAADAARGMRNTHGAIRVDWGDINRIRRGDREEPMPGASAGDPLFVTSAATGANGRGYVNYGYGFAMAVQFGDQPKAVSVVPFGASENPASPHFDDQLDLMLEQRFKPARFAKEDVLRYAVQARGREIALDALGTEGRFVLTAPVQIQARLDTTIEAPATLPPDLTAFTLFNSPVHAPRDTPVLARVHMRVPTELFHPRDFGQLTLFGYKEGVGWRRVPNQERDPQSGTFSARGADFESYAVLGPETALRTPGEAPQPLLTPGPIPSPRQDSPPPMLMARPPMAEELPLDESIAAAFSGGNRGMFPAGQVAGAGQPERPGDRRTFRMETADPNAEVERPTAVEEGERGSGRLFRFEWLNRPGRSETQRRAAADSTSTGPTGRRTFRMERLDEAPAKDTETAPPPTEETEAADAPAGPAPAPAVPSAPPPPTEALQDTPGPSTGQPTGRRVFRIERLDE